MAASEWIDKITDLWGTVEDGRGGFVRSYAVFKRAEFPDALTVYPCAITYITRLPVAQYSAGGPNIVIWRGVSEFHLVPNVLKSNMAYVIGFYDRIIAAAASSITLNGKVSHFLLGPEEPILPGVLQYGDEAPHYGLVVNWEVKELVTLTVSA